MRRRLVLFLFLLTCVLTLFPPILFIMLADSGSTTQDEVPSAITVGVILSGDAADYGWHVAGGALATNVELAIGAHRVILLDHLNMAVRPDMSLDEAVSAMVDQGARVVCISSGVTPDEGETAVTARYPATIFVMNVGFRVDVVRLLAELPGVAADTDRLNAFQTGLPVDLGAAGDPGVSDDHAPSATRSGVMLCVTVSLIISAIAIWLARANKRYNAAVSGRKSGGQKHKRKRHTGGINAKGLAIEDAVRDRMTDFAALGEPEPLVHKLSTYVYGDWYFDESFPVEKGLEFLGECGMGITQGVNRYEKDKITALEVWMFDKTDIQTVTHVLASAHAAGSPSLSTELGKKGPVILAEQDAVTELETKALRLRARILSVQYGFSDTLPARSFFEHLVVEIAVFTK